MSASSTHIDTNLESKFTINPYNLGYDIVGCQNSFYSVVTMELGKSAFVTYIRLWNGAFCDRDEKTKLLSQVKLYGTDENDALDTHARCVMKADDIRIPQFETGGYYSVSSMKMMECGSGTKNISMDDRVKLLYSIGKGQEQKYQVFNKVSFDNGTHLTVMTTQWSDTCFDTRVYNVVLGEWASREAAELGHQKCWELMLEFQNDFKMVLDVSGTLVGWRKTLGAKFAAAQQKKLEGTHRREEEE